MFQSRVGLVSHPVPVFQTNPVSVNLWFSVAHSIDLKYGDPQSPAKTICANSNIRRENAKNFFKIIPLKKTIK